MREKPTSRCAPGLLSLTRMYGPAARCKRFVDLVVSGLASMYPVSSWSCFAPDHHGYQRACDLINGQASTGHPGHQCSHAPGRPILHLYLSSRRPRQETVTSSRAPHTVQFLCSRGPFLRPGPQNVERARDQAGRTPASSVLVSSKARPLASTAQAMRASLLARAIASTLWCNRLLAASIQDLSP